MKKNFFLIFWITVINTCMAFSQNECDHIKMIINFLNKISAKDYIPKIEDYYFFFDDQAEIEEGLLNNLYINNNEKASLEDTNKSLTIKLLLSNKTMKELIEFKNNQNRNWRIINNYPKGSATIVYEVGIECSKQFIKIQVINWKYKDRCGIVDILDSNDRSILINNTE